MSFCKLRVSAALNIRTSARTRDHRARALALSPDNRRHSVHLENSILLKNPSFECLFSGIRNPALGLRKMRAHDDAAFFNFGSARGHPISPDVILDSLCLPPSF